MVRPPQDSPGRFAESDTAGRSDPEARTGTLGLGRFGWLTPRVLLPLAAVVVLALVGLLRSPQAGPIDPARRQAEALLRTIQAAPDARRTSLGGPDAPVSLDVRFDYSRQLGKGVVTASGLPALDADLTYVFWLIGDRGAKPAGLFRPGADGRAIHAIPAGLAAQDGARAVGITVEPAGGSPQPTGKLILSAEIG